jgi:hypothetical protein
MSSAACSESKSATSENGAGPGLALAPPPRHPFVRRLANALLPDLEREMNTALRVGVMLADGLPREHIATKLKLEPAEVRAAIARIERIAEKIDHDDEGVPSY